MKYSINGVACSEMFSVCGQPCLAIAGGVIKEDGEVCYFEQTPSEFEFERAQKICPAGAIRGEEDVPPDDDDDDF